MITFQDKLKLYAALIVKAGVHVRPGQRVYVNCPAECYEFGRYVTEAAYREGASEVIMKFSDDVITKLTYTYASLAKFENFPQWAADERNFYAKDDTAFIHLVGSDPDALKGVSPDKLKANMKSSHEKLSDYFKLQSTMGFKWNVSAVVTKAWAKKVFPELSEAQAVQKLWNAIFKAVRIDGTASGQLVYKRWMRHADKLKKKCEILNAWQLKQVTYKNSLGTDFTVGLVENHIWEGGADLDKKDGGRFFANMPTEEVFTMPDNRVAEGRLVSAMPLSYQGSVIEHFSLDFKNGEVVSYHAEKGEELLKMLLESDEGSRRLGEIALVPFPSPISAQNILFLETLFDENAACHFALGACYETNLKGGPEMTEEELKSCGGNISMNHVDFMVGTADLSITGITKDGKAVDIFKDGTWAF